MTQTLPLDLVDERPILQIGSVRALLDTAAPLSLGDGSRLDLLDLDLVPPPRIGQFDLRALRERIRGNIQAVLGADVLSKVRFLLDWDRGIATFARTGLRLDGRSVSVSKTSGVPFVEAVCNHHAGDGFIGTGSRLSYTHPRFVRGLHPVAMAEDFYPGFGPFWTPVYRLRIELGGLEIESEFGLLPDKLDEAMRVSGTDWIFGSRLLRGGPVLFDLPASRIVLGRSAPFPSRAAWDLA